MSNILNCDLHDYLEIACLYQYRVTLVLKSGGKYTGIPQTTIAKSKGSCKYEVLIFDCENGNTEEIELMALSSMRVLTPHAKFTEVSF
ncbi:Rho-binding antiterminator [Alkalimarinus alittae]|uniref:Rho-binding antiterminator n=1 Tax=Alkalimarinus alittae TaxID=2961619 RepID=A0ABY6N3G6_9ALTE|nr:Rho-binding antiterminator [Alkalimarinus alittae]UZE96657.1 Rho-binding antiterminator [Alkalimarinus alittae]